MNEKGSADGFAPGERFSALLGAITSRLIPSDENGPGAPEANVVGYIEGALATEYSHLRETYALGLAAVDDYAREKSGRGLLELAPAEQDAVLEDIEEGRVSAGGASLVPFFELLLQHTREGMFGDPRWGGNAGNVGWDLIGYPGPRFEWTAEDQVVSDLPLFPGTGAADA